MDHVTAEINRAADRHFAEQDLLRGNTDSMSYEYRMQKSNQQVLSQDFARLNRCITAGTLGMPVAGKAFGLAGRLGGIGGEVVAAEGLTADAIVNEAVRRRFLAMTAEEAVAAPGALGARGATSGELQILGKDFTPIGPYGKLSHTLEETGWQANHLNQNAAYRSIIPKNEGLSNAMRGNTFFEPGTPHYQFHQSLEGFWNQYRPGGALFGTRPTNGQYRACSHFGVPWRFGLLDVMSYSVGRRIGIAAVVVVTRRSSWLI